MKTQKEIYQALVEGKTIKGPKDILIHLEDKLLDQYGGEQFAGFAYPEDWEIVDEYCELKKAYEEGAIIETINRADKEHHWRLQPNPHWYPELEYRIKDGISIESWDKHKSLIMAFWEKAKIQLRLPASGEWAPALSPNWDINTKYRIKDDISIKSWKMQKDVIKAYWDGKPIEVRLTSCEDTWEEDKNPLFIPNKDIEYRVKPEPVLYYRWKYKFPTRIRVEGWYQEGTKPDINPNWIRIEPGKTFEEIQ